MLFRAIALSVALLVSIGTIIPFMTDYTEAGAKHHHKHKRKHLKKYSKAWWRWYHKRQKQRDAVAARKRALRARQMMLAKQKEAGDNNGSNQTATVKLNKQGKAQQKTAVQDDSPALLPSGEAAPNTWKRGQSSKSELQYRVNDDSGNQLGTASLSVVGPSAGADSDSGRNKTLGGVSTSALRRTVIDKMIKQEGWVVNDYQKDVNGKKVYVVVAQSNVQGTIQSHLFYFTEVDGRIYSLATNSSDNSTERIAKESEKVINSLQKTSRPVQAELR